MDELIRKIVAECLTAATPQIAAAVVDELAAHPHEVKSLTRKEAAFRLGLSLPTIDDLIKHGTIRVKRVGRRVLVPEAEVSNLLESGERIKYRRTAR